MNVSGRIVLSILILSGFPALRCGATVYQSDGSAASVQGLHDAVLNGDTITLPAGTFTWTTRVSISKAITLQGAGAARRSSGMLFRAAFSSILRLPQVSRPD